MGGWLGPRLVFVLFVRCAKVARLGISLLALQASKLTFAPRRTRMRGFRTLPTRTTFNFLAASPCFVDVEAVFGIESSILLLCTGAINCCRRKKDCGTVIERPGTDVACVFRELGTRVRVSSLQCTVRSA